MMSNAIADTFLKYGGEIRYNCGASKILLKDGRVTGGVDDRGEIVSTQCVVSNASKITTYTDLIGSENVPVEAFAEMRGSSIGASAVTVYVGFDKSPEELGITHTTTFIGGSGSPETEYTATKALGFHEDTGLSMTCYTHMDSGFSPPGTTMAAIIMLQYAEPWLRVAPEQYAAEKYKAAKGMLERVETVYPGLRDHIEEMEISTPITHMRYLGHPGGAFYGFDQHVKDSASFVSPKPPVEGLYLAGAWATSGGFQPTLESGVRAARRVLKGLGK
jgi:phytoene dehydrogenase-like protein